MNTEQNSDKREKVLRIGSVVCSTDWEQVISEYETAAEFAIFVINETIANVKPYQNGTGIYVDYENIYKNCLPKEVE